MRKYDVRDKFYKQRPIYQPSFNINYYALVIKRFINEQLIQLLVSRINEKESEYKVLYGQGRENSENTIFELNEVTEEMYTYIAELIYTESISYHEKKSLKCFLIKLVSFF